jgi:hypothetical protein
MKTSYLQAINMILWQLALVGLLGLLFFIARKFRAPKCLGPGPPKVSAHSTMPRSFDHETASVVILARPVSSAAT